MVLDISHYKKKNLYIPKEKQDKHLPPICPSPKQWKPFEMQPRGAEGEVGQGWKTHNLGSYLCSIYELSGAWHTMMHLQDPSLESEIISKMLVLTWKKSQMT